MRRPIFRKVNAGHLDLNREGFERGSDLRIVAAEVDLLDRIDLRRLLFILPIITDDLMISLWPAWKELPKVHFAMAP